MKKLALALLGLIVMLPASTHAQDVVEEADAQGFDLRFAQVRIAGDEFMVIQNVSAGEVALRDYWVQYFNEYDINQEDVSGTAYQLPAVTLPAEQAIVLVNGVAENCGYAFSARMSFTLKDSAGYLQLVQLTQNDVGELVYKAHDYVNWTRDTDDFTTLEPPKIQGVSSSDRPVWVYHDDVWQGGSLEPGCSITVVEDPEPPVQVVFGRSNIAPPATIVSFVAAEQTGPVIPASNVGLLSPQITELLPNPASPQTDSEDEFIELYNPNDAPFDLSGFILQVGTDSPKTYTFPTGGRYILAPKSFRAFYSSQTGLALNNTSSRSALLDPFGNMLDQTDVYQSIKEAQSWVLANGIWYATAQPTPGVANVVSGGTGQVGEVVPPEVRDVAGVSTTSAVTGQSAATDGDEDVDPVTPIHSGVLAGVALAAVAYGVYEYRADIANKYRQFRSNRSARRSAGS